MVDKEDLIRLVDRLEKASCTLINEKRFLGFILNKNNIIETEKFIGILKEIISNIIISIVQSRPDLKKILFQYRLYFGKYKKGYELRQMMSIQDFIKLL